MADRRTQIVFRYIPLAGIVVCLIVIVWLVNQLMATMEPVAGTYAPPSPGSPGVRDDSAGDDDASPEAWPLEADGLGSQGQPLDQNPAGLPDPLAGSLLVRYRLPDAAITQELAVWQLESSESGDGPPTHGLGELLQPIRLAAEQAGFELLDRGQALDDEHRVNLMMLRGDQALTLRASRKDQSVRLVYHLRYTTR